MSLCERKFIDDVSHVVWRLSRPLLRRHDIITSCQHAALFQNLEKVSTCLLVFVLFAVDLMYSSFFDRLTDQHFNNFGCA